LALRREDRLSRITDFYLGKTRHPRGVTIEEIWEWSYTRLELEHSYIQWLFPLVERSQAAPISPVLAGEDIREFQHNADLRERLRRSLSIMLAFYGLKLTYNDEAAKEPVIEQSAEFEERATHWITVNNHNYLRITRILRSLGLLGMSREAKEFFAALQRVYVKSQEEVGSYSYGFWKDAVRT
jgi:hypothetical protein